MKTHAPRTGHQLFLLRIVLPALLTLALFTVSLFLIVIPRFEDIILGKKREMIRELTTSAWHVADHFHKEALRGGITEAEAQRKAILQISDLRYGDEGKDYFWITDFTPVMIDHPFRKDLNGTDLSDFSDTQGKKLFMVIVDTARASGEGFVDYTWQWKDDSTRIVPKLSYVKAYEPWGWIIGTGIYIEDVKAEIAELEGNIVTISTWITITITALLLLIVAQNVRSERKRLRAEEDLRESKEKYEALVETTTEGLLMILGGEPLYLNRPLQAMCGYGPEESPAPEIGNFLPQADIAQLHSLLDARPDGETPSPHLETRLTRKDGSQTHVLLTASRVEFYGKSGMVVIVKDISQHREMSLALDESRERFMALTSKLSLAVFRTEADDRMRIVEANEGTSAMLGYENPATLHGLPFADAFHEQQACRALKDDALRHGFVSNRIVRARKRDQSPVDISLSAAVVADSTGEPRFFDMLAEDVSGELQKQERQGRLIAELQAPMMFLQQVSSQLVKPLRECGMNDPASQVARTLLRTASDVVLVRDDGGQFVGLITRDEIAGAGLRRDTGPDLRAKEVMRAPLVTVAATATILDVLALYEESGTRCFAVRGDDGGIIGTLHVEDLFESSLHSYRMFLQRLAAAETVGEVRLCLESLIAFVRMLVEHDASVQSVTLNTGQAFDAATRRIVTLIQQELGPPPADFAFIALGSQGRSEQTLATDQDNAIIHADVAEENAAEVQDYFLALGNGVCRALDGVGFPFCKGEVMAMNPKWCQPLSKWKQYFFEWVDAANPQDLLEVSIFFDFRCLLGSEALTGQLRDHLFKIVSGRNAFFVYLAQNALRSKPPTWQFKAVEQVDMKSVMHTVVDIARLYALKNSVRNTNTLERLAGLRQCEVFSAAGHREISQAYLQLMRLRFRHQARLLASNAQPDNIVITALLTDLERTMLRRILSEIEGFQSKLSLDFKGTI